MSPGRARVAGVGGGDGVNTIGLSGVVNCSTFADPPSLAPVATVYLTLINR